jgi:hypothetical protein
MRYCLGDPHDYGAIWAALGFMPFGLFFDFMDGKIARWRKKSSLMGQELDSLADLVWHLRTPQGQRDAADPYLCTLDLLRPCTSRMRIRSWSPHLRRPSSVGVLRPLWLNTVGPIQRYRRRASQG